jgi:hypothetical protein
MADMTPETIRAALKQQRDAAMAEPRPRPERGESDDVAYSRRMEASWDRHHARSGYRGSVAEPPGPDAEREATPAVPEWQRLLQKPHEWPANADKQSAPGKPLPPWERPTPTQAA